jgi:RNA polymerase sigma factor (TIGR02999 family)
MRKRPPNCVMASAAGLGVSELFDWNVAPPYIRIRLTHRKIDMAGQSVVSGLLRSWGEGDLEARDRLLPLVYKELKKRAAAYLRRERSDHTLQPTALVHELYIRLLHDDAVAWQNRAHFFGIAAQVMRRILIDQAREHQAAKRGGAAMRVALDEGIASEQPITCEILLLSQALDELAHLDARQAQIVEFRYFGGMTEQEVASVLSLSRATVTREWRTARAWLFRRMTTMQDTRS